jgi:UDPglucose--hexose-1-phosphate uridylyltransferase
MQPGASGRINKVSLLAELADHPHRRRNALTGEWVLVSPQRLQRPWQGLEDTITTAPRVRFDPSCPLCPGNLRARGERTPHYAGPYVFDNDYPALEAPQPARRRSGDSGDEAIATARDEPLLECTSVAGSCRVICYSPRHDAEVGDLSAAEIEAVVRVWRDEWRAFDSRSEIAYTLIFENRGAQMGASNLHPHAQLWATSVLPDELEREARAQAHYFERRGAGLLPQYLACEIATAERVVAHEGDWYALVPFWAVWPFEVLLLPATPISGFDELGERGIAELARLWRRLVRGYDALFGVPCPYSMGWHPRPRRAAARARAADFEAADSGATMAERTASAASDSWTLHAHFCPPLLRSASVRKFQVGFEMFGMPQRDLTPEAAAARLRECVPA